MSKSHLFFTTLSGVDNSIYTLGRLRSAGLLVAQSVTDRATAVGGGPRYYAYIIGLPMIQYCIGESLWKLIYLIEPLKQKQ